MNKLPDHKTKIVCTIGPASRSPKMIAELIKSGMNVARLNFSHSDHQEHLVNIRHIHAAAQKMKSIVSILVDLPGVKIRIGRLKEGSVTLKRGEKITLTTKNVLGDASILSVNYRDLPKAVKVGGRIYLNDGFIKLQVEKIKGPNIECRILVEGKLLSFKGLNLPDAKLSINPVTARDLESIRFCLQHGVFIFGLSFIEQAEDIIRVREFARRLGKEVYLVAKIERREAINNFAEILKAADAVMIARGDLGIEIPMEEVPVVQKTLIREANMKGKAVITATQMLASMTQNIRPTRAEVNDVANAIFDGTDAIMLSEETAIGGFPVEAVKTAVKVALSIEKFTREVPLSKKVEAKLLINPVDRKYAVPDTISLNAMEAIERLKAKFVISQTSSGSTVRHISRFKPEAWILAFSNYSPVCELLAMSYGVQPFLLKEKITDQYTTSLNFIKKHRLVRHGEVVLITERRFSSQKGQTDSLGIVIIE